MGNGVQLEQGSPQHVFAAVEVAPRSAGRRGLVPGGPGRSGTRRGGGGGNIGGDGVEELVKAVELAKDSFEVGVSVVWRNCIIIHHHHHHHHTVKMPKTVFVNLRVKISEKVPR